MQTLDDADTHKVAHLKTAMERAVAKREKRVITDLVNAYRMGTLTAQDAYAKVMVIAELRYAGGDIGKKDLQ